MNYGLRWPQISSWRKTPSCDYPPVDRTDAARRTEAWLRDFVVGLGLCPFAGEPLAAGRVRIMVSDAEDPERLGADLVAELARLAGAESGGLETTLLVHPSCLRDFAAYNDFLGVVEAIVREHGHEGTIQVASFHPEYRFAEEPEDDVSHYTNRSPHPMLHLIRESSVTEAVELHPDVPSIPKRNVELLRRMGIAELERVLRGDP
jgi:hypothetical protein